MLTSRIQGCQLLLQQCIDPGLCDGLVNFRCGTTSRDGADGLTIYFNWQAALIGKIIWIGQDLKIAIL